MGTIHLAASRNLVVPVLCKGLSPSQTTRSISTSASLMGKRNFRKFHLGNKRGTLIFRRDQNAGKLPDYPIYTVVKDVGYKYDDQFHVVPEMVPEIVVPNLEDCKLKPYVSYRTGEIHQTEFTAQDLFDVVYRTKITKDFKENKLDEQGDPKEPSDEERLTAERAWLLARRTGSDIFSERTPRLWECLDKDLISEEHPPMAYTSDDLTHPSESKRIPSNTPPKLEDFEEKEKVAAKIKKF